MKMQILKQVLQKHSASNNYLLNIIIFFSFSKKHQLISPNTSVSYSLNMYIFYMYILNTNSLVTAREELIILNKSEKDMRKQDKVFTHHIPTTHTSDHKTPSSK